MVTILSKLAVWYWNNIVHQIFKFDNIVDNIFTVLFGHNILPAVIAMVGDVLSAFLKTINCQRLYRKELKHWTDFGFRK